MNVKTPVFRFVKRAIIYALAGWLAVCVLIVLFGMLEFIVAHRLFFGVLTGTLCALVLASYVYTRRHP